MKCPYCDREMEQGTVRAQRDPVYWCPEGKDINVFTTWGGVERRGGFGVTVNAGKAEAWYCRACNWLMIPNAK